MPDPADEPLFNSRLADLIAEAWAAGLDPFAIIADDLRSFGYTVQEPTPE